MPHCKMTHPHLAKYCVLWTVLVVGTAGFAAASEINRDEPTDLAEHTETSVEQDTAAAADIPAEIDWSELNRLPDLPAKSVRGPASSGAGRTTSSWSRNDRTNGTSAVAVKSVVTPYWDTQVGADLNVVRSSGTLTTLDVLPETALDPTPKNSSASAWASITAPGVSYLWDKTAVDARMDPGTDQGKLGTTLSKSVPLWNEQFALTLQNGYRVIQQAPFPLTHTSQGSGRTLEVERLAKFSITETGTSLIAGQVMSTTDDKWLSKVGAEQKLFGDISVSGTVSETSTGFSNKTLSAGFKKSW